MKSRPTDVFARGARSLPADVTGLSMAALELESSRVVKKIKPNQAGALKLARQYGDALVCVRYRHDACGQRRYTTVEVVIECVAVQTRQVPDVIVHLKLDPFDKSLRSIVQASGGQWDVRERVWKLPSGIAERLDLLGCVVVK